MADQIQGVRYPTLGFWTSGAASTKDGFGPHPYETFSFDVALLDAEIQDFNISTYSSVLPAELVLTDIDKVKEHFFHGAVLEVILAGIGITYSTGAAHRNIGIRTHGRNYVLDSNDAVMAAASCVARQTDIKDSSGKLIGGYVVEYVDTFPTHVGKDAAQKEADDQLTLAIDHLLSIRGLSPTSGERKIETVSYIEVSNDIKYGYTLNGYGFRNFGIRPAVSPAV